MFYSLLDEKFTYMKSETSTGKSPLNRWKEYVSNVMKKAVNSRLVTLAKP